MPTRMSTSRQRCQKRRRMCKSRHMESDEQRILREIEQQVAVYEQKKADAARAKELAILEAKFFEIIKQRRSDEKYNWERANKWTGLRLQPDENVEGRNWMTCYCLRRKRAAFPPDVMFLINQFLNWVPAGCWLSQPNLHFGCSECGIRFIDSYCYGASVCSWQCYEVCLRNRILNDYDVSVNVITNVISQLEPGQLEHEDSISYMIMRMNYRTQYNGFLYRHEHEVMEWYIMMENRDINESSPIYGFYDDNDIDCCYSDYGSDMSMNTQGPDIQSLEDDLEKIKLGLSLLDNEDDVWQKYRSHWDESLTNVFTFRSR